MITNIMVCRVCVAQTVIIA